GKPHCCCRYLVVESVGRQRRRNPPFLHPKDPGKRLDWRTGTHTRRSGPTRNGIIPVWLGHKGGSIRDSVICRRKRRTDSILNRNEPSAGLPGGDGRPARALSFRRDERD